MVWRKATVDLRLVKTIKTQNNAIISHQYQTEYTHQWRGARKGHECADSHCHRHQSPDRERRTSRGRRLYAPLWRGY